MKVAMDPEIGSSGGVMNKTSTENVEGKKIAEKGKWSGRARDEGKDRPFEYVKGKGGSKKAYPDSRDREEFSA